MHSCLKNVLLLSILLPYVILVTLHMISISFLTQVGSLIAKYHHIPTSSHDHPSPSHNTEPSTDGLSKLGRVANAANGTTYR